MPNPKKEYQSPECKENTYFDTAKSSADNPTGFEWSFFGPAAGHPMPPVPPVPAPLAAAAEAALQTLAKTNAIAAATVAMNKIAAQPCPLRCPTQASLTKALSGPARLVTRKPELVEGVTDVHFTAVIPMVLIFRWQYWHQEAEQDYEVAFDCLPAVEG